MRQANWCAHALPLNDWLFREPFYVTHAGRERVRPRQRYPHSGQPYYYENNWADGRVLGEFCLSFISRGQGELETNQGRQALRAPQAFLYLPGEWHRHRPTPAVGWTNQWIKFNGSWPHRWMQQGAFARNGNLVELADTGLFQRQFRHLIEAVDAANGRNSLQFSWQAIGLLSHFLVDGGAPEAAPAASTGGPLVDAVRDYIWSHSHNQISVLDIARHTGLNRRTLERGFKEGTGTTLFNEIQHCRISRAALLLRESDVSIKYVIGRAGFTSYQQIRLAFKKHFGLSPEEYRARRVEPAARGRAATTTHHR
jgi:AraC-like DNA-binding protein